MSHVLPAIIPASLTDLDAHLSKVSAFTKVVQIDIVDGVFVPDTSWPYGEGEEVASLHAYASQFAIEVDLMVQKPERVIDAYATAGVKDIVIHLESTEHICDIIEHYAEHSYRLGLSVLNSTPLRTLVEYVPYVDFVQLMGIRHIGAQGQPFDESVLGRVSELRAQFPELEISIDGSVNAETLPKLKEAGANRFVAGSAILGAEDPSAAFFALEALATTTL